MDLKWIDERLAVAEQLSAADFAGLAEQGIKRLVCVRPDTEEGDYLTSAEARALAAEHGMSFEFAPVRGVDVTPAALDVIEAALEAGAAEEPGSALAYCRSGRRVALAWAMVQVHGGGDIEQVLAQARAAGFELAEFAAVLTAEAVTQRRQPIASARRFDVVVVGGGSAGIATAASLLRRRADLTIAVIEPAAEHHYQPGLTLVGTGWFDPERITRAEADLMPAGVVWIQAAVAAFEPDADRIRLEDGSSVGYQALVVATGLMLDFDGIEGAREALGRDGVCCNYSPAHAPYTWEQVQGMRSGRALFTQPPMPIKCAGAPQKAMYLACDRWRQAGLLAGIDVQFHNAGAALFGVAHFVPVLMEYVQRYGIELEFGSRLVAIDADGKVAHFEYSAGEGDVQQREVAFDLLHFVPPQRAPEVIASSPLADAEGWLAVDPTTLQHPGHGNVFGAGDVIGTGNAKTMAAARKHAGVVAENLLAQLDGRALPMGYDGYGACPLTVEGGKVVLAEFGYEGKLLPTFPLEAAVPRHTQWMLKRHLMPRIYWDLMLKGREWFAAPQPIATSTKA